MDMTEATGVHHSWTMFFLPLVFLACLCEGCQRPAGESGPATRVGVVGLKTAKMNYHAAQQHESNWCWAASIQMALSAKGIAVSQEEIVQNAFGRIVDRPGSPEEILASLNGWTLNGQGQRIQVAGTVGLGPPPFAILKRQLETGTPVVVGYENPEGEVGHAVVVTAVIYEMTERGPQIQRVMVRDPWPSLSDSSGKRELSAGEFARVRAYYVIETMQF